MLKPPPTSSPSEKVECVYCCKLFAHKRSLSVHLSKKHPDLHRNYRVCVPCPVEGCECGVASRQALGVHLDEQHGFEQQPLHTVFSTHHQLHAWLEELAGRGQLFIKTRGFRASTSYSMLCARDGKEKRNMLKYPFTNKFKSRLGSYKTGHACPAYIRIKHFDDGSVEVQGQMSHYGHDFDRATPMRSARKRTTLLSVLGLSAPPPPPPTLQEAGDDSVDDTAMDDGPQPSGGGGGGGCDQQRDADEPALVPDALASLELLSREMELMRKELDQPGIPNHLAQQVGTQLETMRREMRGARESLRAERDKQPAEQQDILDVETHETHDRNQASSMDLIVDPAAEPAKQTSVCAPPPPPCDVCGRCVSARLRSVCPCCRSIIHPNCLDRHAYLNDCYSRG